MAKDRGLFISFEGIDGSGKSTQAKTLGSALAETGREVVLTREPGGSDGAESIRRLLVEGAEDRWSAVTECLLFTAARRDHVERVIRPALKRGAIVICDRFADSTRVYQGAVRADLREMVDDLNDRYIALDPDLTFLVDVDPEIALTRGLARNSGEDRYENFGLDFQRQLRTGFLELATKFAERIHLVDGNRPASDIAQDIVHLVRSKKHV